MLVRKSGYSEEESPALSFLPAELVKKRRFRYTGGYEKNARWKMETFFQIDGNFHLLYLFDYMTKVNKFPNLIPHKVLNIRGYICTCLDLFFIFDFIRLLKYQILQFHSFFIFCYIILIMMSSYYIALFSEKNGSI